MTKRLALLVALAVGWPAIASAQDEDDEEISPTTQYSHKGQFGVSAQVGTGYRIIFPYNKEYCGQLNDNGENKANCLGRSPAALDLALTYGVTRGLELMLEFRFGLESDFGITEGDSGPKPFAVHPGIRLYIDDAGQTKFFSAVAAAFDLTSYDQADTTDIGIRNTNGLQFDLHKTVGIYFFFGETIGFSRWLRFELDGGLGIQARFP